MGHILGFFLLDYYPLFPLNLYKSLSVFLSVVHVKLEKKPVNCCIPFGSFGDIFFQKRTRKISLFCPSHFNELSDALRAF